MLSSTSDDSSSELLVQKVVDVICAMNRRPLPPEGQTDGHTDGQMDEWTDRQTDGRMDRWTEGQMDRWTETDEYLKKEVGINGGNIKDAH